MPATQVKGSLIGAPLRLSYAPLIEVSGMVGLPHSVTTELSNLTYDYLRVGGDADNDGIILSSAGGGIIQYEDGEEEAQVWLLFEMANTVGLTGTCAFTQGTTAVVGTGTTFTTEVDAGQYVKVTAHGDECWARVDVVTDNTHLTLSHPYRGVTASAASSVASLEIQGWHRVGGVLTQWVDAFSTPRDVSLYPLCTLSHEQADPERAGDLVPFAMTPEYIARYVVFRPDATLPAVRLVPNSDVTLEAGFGIVIPSRYEIPSGVTLTLETDSVLEIT